MCNNEEIYGHAAELVVQTLSECTKNELLEAFIVQMSPWRENPTEEQVDDLCEYLERDPVHMRCPDRDMVRAVAACASDLVIMVTGSDLDGVGREIAACVINKVPYSGRIA